MNLKCFKISDDIYNKILENHKPSIIELDTFEDKSYYEYRKKIIYFKDTKHIIINEVLLDYYCNCFAYPTWKQVKLEPSENAQYTIEDSINGSYAWFYIMKTIKRHYTEQEIESILNAFCDTETSSDNQFHYNWPIVSQNVQKVRYCVKYDINGAHTDALREMFPKCKLEFEQIYIKRHDNIKYKEFPNFFVGMLKKKGYESAYWHIVHRTTKLLYEAIEKVGGQLIYANTDGFCVSKPKTLLKTSDKLGEFKLEHEGNVYIYSNRKRSPYILYQFGETADRKHLIGSCITIAREGVDLAKGIISTYTRVSKGYYVTAEDIEREQVCVEQV